MRLSIRPSPVILPGTLPFAAAALLLCGALAACAQPGEGSHLRDSHWRFVTIDGKQPISDAADMTFENGKIGVVVGCNRMGGPWRVADNRLVAGPLSQTEMACPLPAWDQEKAVGALLAATPRMVMEEDRMTLQSSGHTAELVRITKAE